MSKKAEVPAPPASAGTGETNLFAVKLTRVVDFDGSIYKPTHNPEFDAMVDKATRDRLQAEGALADGASA